MSGDARKWHSGGGVCGCTDAGKYNDSCQDTADVQAYTEKNGCLNSQHMPSECIVRSQDQEEGKCTF